MCPQGRAYWRHLANTIELVLPSAHPSPQPKRQIDRFSCFCTGHGRKCQYFTLVDLSPKITHSRVVASGPIYFMIRWTRPSPQSKAHNPNGICIGSAVFARMTAECPYTLQWDVPFFPQNCPFPWGDLDPHLIHGFLGPPESSAQMASRSVQPF